MVMKETDKGIRCPRCKSTKTEVIRTSRKDGTITRRRRCRQCAKQFDSIELLDLADYAQKPINIMESD